MSVSMALAITSVRSGAAMRSWIASAATAPPTARKASVIRPKRRSMRM
jgi:hypothetical protein